MVKLIKQKCKFCKRIEEVPELTGVPFCRNCQTFSMKKIKSEYENESMSEKWKFK